MAFLWFAECGVDTAVIEVGLGGRLDSTNVITPDLSIITNISLEHQAMLGDTIEKIAFEKAGIIKPHVPVVIGEKNASFSVFMQQAEEKQATLFLAEENVSCNLLAGDNGNMELDISYLQRLLYPELLCSLTGTYQQKNVSTVVQAVEVLRSGDYDISDDAVYNGLARIQQNTGFAGRWQIVAQQPTIICDCAHNAAGLQEVFRQVDRLVYNTLHIVTGAVHDKDISANLSCFPQKAQYYFTRPDVPRGLDANILQQEASAFGLSGQAYPQVRAAVDAARKNAGADDLILICGSIFVVAEALPIFSEM
ncbi:MAG: Mur ligase family protein [Chitinophagales bacterium]